MIGSRIRSLRKKNKITQDELGIALGLSGKSAISNYENGYSAPDGETLSKIADYFKVSTDYLLGRTDDPAPTHNLEKTNKWPSMVRESEFIYNFLNDKWNYFLAQLPEDQAMLYQNTDYPDEEKIAIMEEAEKAKQKKLKKIEKFMQYPIEVIDDALIYAAFDAEQRKKMDDEN